MIENAIKKVIRGALSRLSNEKEIHILNLRVKISKKDGNLKFEILDGTNVIGDTELKTVLNITGTDLFGKEAMVGNSMNKSITSLCKSENIEIQDINVRIFTRNQDTVEPQLYLYNGGKAVRLLKFSEII